MGGGRKMIIDRIYCFADLAQKSAQAACRAGLLLRRLDDDAIDQELMTSCAELDRVISQVRRPGVTPPHSISKPPRSRSSQTCAAGVFNPN